MIPFEPGPFADREPWPAIDWPDYGAQLRALLEPVVATLGASDAVLVPAQQTLASVNAGGLAEAYAVTIGHADATLAAHAHDADDVTAFALDENGQVTVGLAGQVAPYLPPVDTPIPVDFTNPPGPPQPTHPPEDEPPDSGNL